MHLPGNVICRLTGGVVGQFDPTGRRRAPRMDLYSCLPIAAVDRGAPGEASEIIVRNISTSGLSFLAARALAVGERVVVWVPDGCRKLSVHSTIKWVREMGRVSFAIGAHFSFIGCNLPARQPG